MKVLFFLSCLLLVACANDKPTLAAEGTMKIDLLYITYTESTADAETQTTWSYIGPSVEESNTIYAARVLPARGFTFERGHFTLREYFEALKNKDEAFMASIKPLPSEAKDGKVNRNPKGGQLLSNVMIASDIINYFRAEEHYYVDLDLTLAYKGELTTVVVPTAPPVVVATPTPPPNLEPTATPRPTNDPHIPGEDLKIAFLLATSTVDTPNPYYYYESKKVWRYAPTPEESEAILDSKIRVRHTNFEFTVRQYFEARINDDKAFLEAVTIVPPPAPARASDEPRAKGTSTRTGPDIYAAGFVLHTNQFYVDFDLSLVYKAEVEYPRSTGYPDPPIPPPR